MRSDSVQFFTCDEVLEIHNRLIAKFGSQGGMRDFCLLLSALCRPQTGYYNDLAEMGTAFFESLIINRSFVDEDECAAFFG